MSLEMKKRVLAIDYGTKRIGLARSDPFGLFAQPVGTFDREELFKAIEVMMGNNDIEKIIVGYPLSYSEEINAMTGVIDRFIESLAETFPGLTIEAVDEHRSSREAHSILIASGTSRKKRQQKGRLDSAAACILLSDYLESREGKQ